MASFSLLYKFQLQIDHSNNNNTISQELKEILDRARALLCDIEHFVNATSNKNGNYKPDWYRKEEMAKIVTLKKNNKHLLNNLFVKSRFQEYIEKLYKRIKNFNLDKNLEVKSLANKRRTTTRRARKNHGNRRKTSVGYIGESTPTSKTFIVTTKKSRPKNASGSTKFPGQKKKNRTTQTFH